MAKNTQRSYATCNAAATAVGSLCDNGYLRIYDGTQPANADTAVSTQTLLSEHRFSATAFGAASNGVITANAITSDDALATSTATWFRVLKSDGTTVVFDGSVGTSNANLVLGTTSFSTGLTVDIDSLTYTINRANA